VLATDAIEIIALDVYRIADDRPVTLALCERRIAELLAHPPDCRCICRAAARAKPSRVFELVASWQRVIALTRVQARR
jgi:hypothetical protein